MEQDSLVVGRHYAFRDKVTPGTPLLKVKLLDKVGRGGRVKIRFEDGPHPGLEEYARTRQLIVPWGQRRALMRDEERLESLAEHHARVGASRAVAGAISAVLESSGEPSAYCTTDGLAMPEEELDGIVSRAGLKEAPADLHPLAFRDRHGQVHLPIEAAEGLARAFAAAEPQTVLMYIQDREEEYKTRGYQPGERIYHQFLREDAPGFALARQWAGIEQEVEQLQNEIGRLRRLVSMAAYDLRDAGKEHKSRRLLRALEGR